MLKRLGVDYLDLLYIHQLVGDYLGAWVEMEQAFKERKVRALGICNFDYDDELLYELLQKVTIKPQMLQIECHPYARSIGMN